jgi:hypothetical protein
LIGQALALGALTMLHQASAPSLSGQAISFSLAGLGAGVYAASSWVLWQRYDELFRRIVVDAFAWTGGLATIAMLVWAALDVAGVVGSVSGFGVFLAGLAAQTVFTTALSVRHAAVEIQ